MLHSFILLKTTVQDVEKQLRDNALCMYVDDFAELF